MKKGYYLSLAIFILLSSCYGKHLPDENEQYFSEYKVEDNPVLKNETTFVAFGDFGTGGKEQYQVSQAIEEKCKKDGCDFALLLGDNIYYGGVKDVDDLQFQQKFEKPYENLNFKMYATLGNHDYRGNTQAQIDYTKKSKKWIMPDRTYKFKENNIEFFSIDSNEPSEYQEKALEKSIKDSKAKWKIVFGHHPRYSHGIHGNANRELSSLIDKAVCNHADIYIAGHDHDLEHLKKTCGAEFLVVGGGGDGIRPVGNGENTRFSKSSFGFSWFKVTDNYIYFQLIDKDGKIIYDYRFRKSH